MQVIQYPANFVSNIYYLRDLAELAPARTVEAYAQVTAVEAELKRAQTHFGRQEYPKAIDAYRSAHATIYSFLNPEISVEAWIADRMVMLPLGRDYEEGIAKASLALAEEIHSKLPSPPIMVNAPALQEPGFLARFTGAGFKRRPDPQTEVREMIGQGTDLLAAGRVSPAIEALENAYHRLEQPGTRAERELAGAAALNLSSAYIMAGDDQLAGEMAGVAAELFGAAEDDLGRAQASHNLGIVYKRTGLLPESEAALNSAAELYQAARNGTGASLDETDASAFVGANDTSKAVVRWTGDEAAASGLEVAEFTASGQESWYLGIEARNDTYKLIWNAGARPAVAELLQNVYEPRVQAGTLNELLWRPRQNGEIVAYLTHVYAFVIPQALGDCHHAQGDYQRAEQYYLEAAQYSYINLALEATALWIRMANNYVDWGDSLYKQEQIAECRPVYARLVLEQGAEPADSPLYTLPVFAVPATEARRLLAGLADPAAVPINPAIAWPILVAWARWQYLLAGLDFFGTAFTPVFTFAYLQEAARSFAQQAIQAEREFVNFQVHAEAESATRRELAASLAMADAEVGIWQQQLAAAQADTRALNASVELATLRANQARVDRDEYATAGYYQYHYQSVSAAMAAGADWYEDEIRRLAANMEAGSARGKAGKMAAAATLLGGQKSYEYQLSRLDRTIEEMDGLIPVAEAQRESARRRESAAALNAQAALQRRALTADALAAFDQELFTPELWARMAALMRRISGDYQEWAIRTAKLMERAYNFETDSDLHAIMAEYPAAATEGLLGSDCLLRDIESFTYHYLAQQRGKTALIKEVVSLANDYPFQFYAFQRTGRVTLDTALHDFEQRYPGFYGQRIDHVEVEMVALMPPGGVHGYLRSGSISSYRAEDGSPRIRFHLPDTAALSDYAPRNDAFLFRSDPRTFGLFEGHGVAGTWELALPRRSNNFDYRLITDVRLIFYYTARFSPALRATTLAAQPLPGELIHVRSLLARWDFPEAWYVLLDSGRLELDVTEDYLPRNEANWRADKVSLQLLTREGVSPAGVELTLALPEKEPATLPTDANGVAATAPGNAFAARIGGPLVGRWQIDLHPAAGSPLLDANGALRGELIVQLVIVVQYAFDWPT